MTIEGIDISERRASAWPGVDLDELVPRGVAYREVYASFGRAAAERTAYAAGATQTGRAVLGVDQEWQAAGLRAAARIAHDVFVDLGNWARARAALLPEAERPSSTPPVVTADVPGERL